MSEIKDALARARRGESSEAALHRALMRHPDWWAAGGLHEDQQHYLKLLRLPSGDRVLRAFSSRDALERARDAERGQPTELAAPDFLSTEGLALFRVMEPGVAAVDLDAYDSHFLRIEGEGVTRLRRWAVTCRLEAALEDPSREESPLSLLRRYPWYELALEGEGAERALLLAPDARGRRLAAIFTSPDALALYLAQVGEQLTARAAQATLTGEELFVSLKQMGLDGLVVNCCGPTPPRALGLGVLDAILST
jgi:hypothetical protein